VGGATRIISNSHIKKINFNPRSPWGERPIKNRLRSRRNKYFNPRSPWGERPRPHPLCEAQRKISIHAPRGGSDRPHCKARSQKNNFNPRSPWGERLFNLVTPFKDILISIHAPRGGSDIELIGIDSSSKISIHAPRGGSDSITIDTAGRI